MDQGLFIGLFLLGFGFLFVIVLRCSCSKEETGTDPPENMKILPSTKTLQAVVRNDTFTSGSVLKWGKFNGDLDVPYKDGIFSLRHDCEYEIESVYDPDISKGHAIVQLILRTGKKEKIVSSTLFHDLSGPQVVRYKFRTGQQSQELFFHLLSGDGPVFFSDKTNLIIKC